MEPFKKLQSRAVPLLIDNVDTDQIIPARFLKQTTRDGFGNNLFRDWRYDTNGTPRIDFVLNDPEITGDILLAGDNFGCGSSREHAVWALSDYGFKTVISTSFADIFKNNALNNGLLPIEVSKDFYSGIIQEVEQNRRAEIAIDLENQSVEINGKKETFEIDEFKKFCILEGKDEFALLIDAKEEITNYETSRK